MAKGFKEYNLSESLKTFLNYPLSATPSARLAIQKGITKPFIKDKKKNGPLFKR